MSGKSIKSYTLQAFSLIALSFSLVACDGSREINMLPPGDGSGPEKPSCDERCSLATAARSDQFSKIALLSSSWSEMILAAALGQDSQGDFGECIVASVSGENDTILKLTSLNNKCTKGAHTVSSNLQANIERDSNGSITKITVVPTADNQVLNGTMNFSFRVKSIFKGQYDIETLIRIKKLEITKGETSLEYDYHEELEIYSDREPDTDIAGRYSKSEFETETLVHKGRLFKGLDVVDGKAVLVTDALMKEFKMDTLVSILEDAPANRNPYNFSSEFKMNMSDNSAATPTECGVVTGKFDHTNEFKKESLKNIGQWERDGYSQSQLDIDGKRIFDPIAQESSPITTCQNQLAGRLFDVAEQLNWLFAELHGPIGNFAAQSLGTQGQLKNEKSGSQKLAPSNIPSPGAEFCEKNEGKYIPGKAC